MKYLKKYLKEDITKYHYLMSEKEIKNYHKIKMQLTLIGAIAFLILFYVLGLTIMALCMYITLVVLMYKLCYISLLLRHRQRANDIVDAVPLWVNTIYALIGEHNIHNAIELSLETCPKVLKYDLENFIKQINENDDKEAYLNFLSKYNIEGFRDVMLKMYEFRNLSKEKLKYEISALNKSLSGFEKMKRERRFKSELFIVDTIVMVMIGVPCVYLFLVSLLMTEVLM